MKLFGSAKYDKAAAQQGGFTLLEVLVAIAVTAMVATMAAGAFTNAEKAQERTRKTLEKMQRLDRAWIVMETDLRNALGKQIKSPDGEVLPAMLVDESKEHWMGFMRGGRPNPMHFYRSELARVQYSLEDEVLVRRLWNDPANLDEDLAQEQYLLKGVTEMKVRMLPRGSNSLKSGQWVDEWPINRQFAVLPHAIEITMVLEERGEIVRLFAMVQGT